MGAKFTEATVHDGKLIDDAVPLRVVSGSSTQPGEHWVVKQNCGLLRGDVPVNSIKPRKAMPLLAAANGDSSDHGEGTRRHQTNDDDPQVTFLCISALVIVADVIWNRRLGTASRKAMAGAGIAARGVFANIFPVIGTGGIWAHCCGGCRVGGGRRRPLRPGCCGSDHWCCG